MLYQWFSVDFDKGFSGETSGIVSGWNDCYGGVDVHQNTALDLSTTMRDSGGPLFGRKVAPTAAGVLKEFIKKRNRSSCIPGEHVNIMSLLLTKLSAGILGDMGE